ncbi:phosphotransferase [Solitalea longa]|nr:phosphotransferase [Solitalea longa]
MNTQCRIIKAGINHTYRVTDQSTQYAFRVYSLNWRTIKEIEEEISLLNLLKEEGVSVSYPIADKDSNFIQTLNAPEGPRLGVLFSYANGQKIHSYSKEIHFQAGQLMANVHRLTVNKKLERVNYSPAVLLEESLKKLGEFLSADSQEMAFMKSLQHYLLTSLSSANHNDLRQGIVHLDIWFDNFNINAENEITLFDFDFCGNGWLALDLAYYIMQLHNMERYEEKNYQPKIESFLKGYESIVKTSEEERRLLPMLGLCVYFFYLGVQCQRYDNWSNSFLSEDYLKRFINGLIKRYAGIYNLAEA